MKILILGFYGVGKTTALKDFPNAVDLTDVPRHEGEDFPVLDILMDYWNDERYDIVMGDPLWTKVFIQSGIPFYVVIPSKNRKEEFFTNYRNRFAIGEGGGDDIFCEYVSNCWDGWLDFYRNKIPSLKCFILKRGVWMADVINHIIKYEKR